LLSILKNKKIVYHSRELYFAKNKLIACEVPGRYFWKAKPANLIGRF
jgi:hypothetical protein